MIEALLTAFDVLVIGGSVVTVVLVFIAGLAYIADYFGW